MILKGYLISLVYGLFCIGISIVAHKLSVKSFYTRKITHILVGFEWVILQHYFGASIHFVVICLLFTLLIWFIYKTGLVPSLSSNGDNSKGTIYYCLAMTAMSIVVLILPQMMIPFGVGVFCTSLGDGFAGVFGSIKKHNPKIYANKTLFGFLSCFTFSLLSVIVICSAYSVEMNILYALLISVFAAVLELFAEKGIDNLTITVGVSFLSYFCMEFPTYILYYAFPIILTLPIVMFVRKKKALTIGGIAVALILDVISAIAFGNLGFIILLLFFGGSIVTDKLKKGNDNHREERTAIQVLANGSLGIFFAAMHLIIPSKIWFVGFASVFAEAFADTAASGIGSNSAITYDIFKMKKVDSGVSGGMSILGTISAVVASMSVAFVSALTNQIGYFEIFVILISGFAGCVIDSLLGSLIQGKYKCDICGKYTDDRIHCGIHAKKISGFYKINNNTVNFLSTIFSSVMAILLMLK